ncbi:MAG TPA: arginine--tRNA ligase [Abditibacteriaceae bacterium]|jgi:arginyl-tRNA synthetase
MTTVQQKLQNAVNHALQTLAIETSAVTPDALRVVPTANAQHGDYQWNGALPLAKSTKQNPRALAQSVVEKLDVAEISAAPEIAGPGFINFRLTREFLENATLEATRDERQGVPVAETPRTVVVDFSGPNVAKPMHVGHIRSTILGDAVARLLRFAGHTVVTDNHIGDWGTQFGKMIIGWKNHRDEDALQRDPIAEMERLYKKVNAAAETDETIANLAREETTKLQNGDAENLAIWHKLIELSQAQFDEIYGRLNIEFDYTRGESFYNPALQGVVEDLKQKGIAVESQGAVIVPFDEPKSLQDKPLLVQKQDGSSLYGTTDLATIQSRVVEFAPDEIVYVVDARQALHFQQLFEAAKKWGYTDIAFHHVSFGSILGEDNRPIKTRSGESIRLKDLLDEAESRALQIVEEKNPDLPEEAKREVARAVGLGAVKYADLSQNRTTDYVFAWSKMLALTGNTAPYLQNAHVRIRSIFRKAGIAPEQLSGELHLEADAEVALAKLLLRFPLAIETALSDYRLNALADYLFDVAQRFAAFYEACPVLISEEPTKTSRLILCSFTADVLKRGLHLLGIEAPEQM